MNEWMDGWRQPIFCVHYEKVHRGGLDDSADTEGHRKPIGAFRAVSAGCPWLPLGGTVHQAWKRTSAKEVMSQSGTAAGGTTVLSKRSGENKSVVQIFN